MSKVICIFAVFFVMIAFFVVVFYRNVPKSLETMKAEIVETGQKNGFDVEIRDARINSFNVIEFEDISIGDFSKSINARVKLCKFEISISDYVKALFERITKNEKIFLKNISQKASLSDIYIKIAEYEIAADAAYLFFENENLRYVISAGTIQNSGFNTEDFAAFGIIDNGFCHIDSKFGFFGGEAGIKGELDFQNISLKNFEIELKGIDIDKLPLNFNVSGKLGAKIIPQADKIAFGTGFIERIKETNAICSLRIDNFRDLGNECSKHILTAVEFVGIKSMDFAEINADFDYSPSKISLKNFLADNFRYSVSAVGFYIPQNERYNFSVGIHFNPDMKSNMQKNVWDIMALDAPKNQGRYIGAKVFGKGSDFTVSFDDEIMKRGVNSLLSQLNDIFK